MCNDGTMMGTDGVVMGIDGKVFTYVWVCLSVF